MAVNRKEKRQSAIDPGMPHRQPGVDPTRTGFDEASRAGAAGLYAQEGDDTPPTVIPTGQTVRGKLITLPITKHPLIG